MARPEHPIPYPEPGTLSDERFLRTTVIDLEVEDFNTYFVNGHWAHGA